jgi:hypothetical protein
VSKRITAAIVLALILGGAGVTIGLIALTNTTNGGPSTSLPQGFYVDGKAGTPHYYVTVIATSSNTLKGAVDYVYQDGQSDVTFTFSGVASDGVANLHILYGNTTSAKHGPSALVMLYTKKQVQLGECTSSMSFATSLSACNFSAASSPYT